VTSQQVGVSGLTSPPAAPLTLAFHDAPGGRTYWTGPNMYTREALQVVAERVPSWLAQSPALRRANRTSSRAFWLATDSQDALRGAGLEACAVKVVEEWFANGASAPGPSAALTCAADCPPLDHATEVFKLPLGHPANQTAGRETRLGLRATKGLTRGDLVVHYTGLVQTKAEWLTGDDREDELDFTYDVDTVSESNETLSERARTHLILEGAPAWSDRPTGSPASCYGGLINGQGDMDPESINAIHFTVIGTACCALCPTFPHPHIFHMARRDIRVEEEIILEYGGTHFASADEGEDEDLKTVGVESNQLKGEMCLATFDIRLRSGEVLRPVAFEERSGRGKNKNWRRSISVVRGPAPAPCTILKFLEAHPTLGAAALRLVRPGRAKRARDEPDGSLGALLDAVDEPAAASGEGWLTSARAAAEAAAAAASRRVAALARYEQLAAIHAQLKTQLAATASEMESLRIEIQRGV